MSCEASIKAKAATESSVESLIEISRYFGKNPDYVLGGGGNASWKNEETLFIKGSGMSLADVVPDSFVRMERKALARIWEKTYPAESAEREKAVLSDLMAARKPGEEQKRPSVETMLHDLLPFDFVVHLHPALVNGLTCSQHGEEAMRELFPEKAVWIPSTNPGYILSLKVKTALQEYSAKHSLSAQIIFLQNHGVFAGASGADGIKEIYKDIMKRIGRKIKRQPDLTPVPVSSGTEIDEIVKTLAELAGGSAAFLCNSEIASLLKNSASFVPVSSAFTPDHIVYAGSDPLFIEAPAALKKAWKNHADKTGKPPKIAAVHGLGVFGAAASEKAANLALELFKDTVKVAVFSESFGGPLFMSREQIDFINNWEVEQFRSRVSAQ